MSAPIPTTAALSDKAPAHQTPVDLAADPSWTAPWADAPPVDPAGRVVIVGAGHAGAQGAIALRRTGHRGPITLLEAAPDPLPYERPPLSKDYLTGQRPPDRLPLRPAAFWAERDVTLVGGAAVTRLDAAARTVHAADGRHWRYDALLWATGGATRPLPVPGADLVGVHSLRTRADADALRTALPDARTAVVVGGGYIGLEAAAALTTLGLAVSVVEAGPRLLPRVTGPTIAAALARRHEQRGVTLLTGATVLAVTGADGRARAVLIRDEGGTERALAADLIVYGIGIVPAVAPLLAAGAAAGPPGVGGVRVDACAHTSLPQVFAAGDGAAHANRFAKDGAVIRLESVQHASDQAAVAAGAIHAGAAAPPYAATPWFWSNQYDHKLQTVGLMAGADQEVVRGDPAGGMGDDGAGFSVAYLRRGRLVALDALDAPRDYIQARALIEAGLARGLTLDPARLADPAVPLKSLLG